MTNAKNQVVNYQGSGGSLNSKRSERPLCNRLEFGPACDMPHDPREITVLLKTWRGGDAGALDRLTPLVYNELRQIAGRYVVKERIDRQLNATALVHEAYVKLVDAGSVDWQDRAHFFAIAARIMRRILVDAARVRSAAKRGGSVAPLAKSSATLDQLPAPETDRSAEICALDDALEALAILDPRRARVVELRFFGGLSVEETAVALSISPQTVMRHWKVARAWLARELRQ
jgi:RNA polymerase sigma-70 factor, ECF subfamily